MLHVSKMFVPKPRLLASLQKALDMRLADVKKTQNLSVIKLNSEAKLR